MEANAAPPARGKVAVGRRHDKAEPGEWLPARLVQDLGIGSEGGGGGTSVMGDLGRWFGARESSRCSAIEQPRVVEGSERRSHQEVEPERRHGPVDSESLLWAVLGASAWSGRAIPTLLAGPSICERKAPG